MITFWCDRNGRGGVTQYLAFRGAAIADRFVPRVYEDVAPVLKVRRGAQIFGALEQLEPSGRAVVERLHDGLAAQAPDVPRLNDPRRVLLRPALLRRLHADGLNAFRVFAASEVGRLDRFPVFIRHATGHEGTLTPLLQTRAQVARALAALVTRGSGFDDLLIVELCDTKNRQGLYRKYAAFRVGDRIIPCHLMASPYWMVKSESNAQDEALLREGSEYIDNNPHEDWITHVFAVAGIEYGRIDYGMLGERPQVWEINLHPTIGRGRDAKRAALPPALDALRQRQREVFHARLREAFVALDERGAGPDATVDVAIGEELAARARRDAERRARREQRVEQVGRMYMRRWVGLPLRVAYRLLRGSRRASG